jgi:predicted metal-dependent phosphoesterase TrpH
MVLLTTVRARSQLGERLAWAVPTPRIDLHTHSTASDGTDSPEGLVAAAAAAGLHVVALTDHDTTVGWTAAAAVLPAGMQLVRGAEFSCVCHTGRGDRDVSVHLLGYLFDPEHEAIVTEQARLRAERVERLHRMTATMAADGYPVDAETVFSYLPDGASAGRPHLARALVAAGVVSSVNEAFAKLLYSGSPYYVPKSDTPVTRAIEMVRAAGGVAVFAHPLARRRGRVVESSVIAELAAVGLAGVEVDHPDHSVADRALLRGLAGELDLVVTGSSDYHGTNKSTPIGAERTTPEALAELVSRAAGVPVLAG